MRCWRRVLSTLIVTLGVATAVLGSPGRAEAEYTFAFGPTLGSVIDFNATDPAAGQTGSFTFNNLLTPGDPTFQITTIGPLLGLKGDITGTFNIGAITVNGSKESATVTSSPGAKLQIIDADNNVFSADVAWLSIFTEGTSGGLNAGGVINLTNISYSGSNTTLLDAAGGTGTVSFQFAEQKSLTDLTTIGAQTSFSGSVSLLEEGELPTPAPAGLVLMASGAPFLLVGRFIRRRLAREPKIV